MHAEKAFISYSSRAEKTEDQAQDLTVIMDELQRQLPVKASPYAKIRALFGKIQNPDK